jgi:hypothetical protein
MYICACIDLWISAEALLRMRGVFFWHEIQFFLGVALILGAGGDDKHKYFFICPLPCTVVVKGSDV